LIALIPLCYLAPVINTLIGEDAPDAGVDAIVDIVGDALVDADVDTTLDVALGLVTLCEGLSDITDSR
jgi:hypothetical protein